MLTTAWLPSPVGTLKAVANETALLELGFSSDAPKRCHHPILEQLDHELTNYLTQEHHWNIPVKPQGTPFQQKVWQQLLLVPYGTTSSYLELASALGCPQACRAVAQALGANPIALIIPCHRIIRHNGELGGYAGGLTRKKWLLTHERALVKDALS